MVVGKEGVEELSTDNAQRITIEDVNAMDKRVDELSDLLDIEYEDRLEMLANDSTLSQFYCLSDATIAMMLVDYYRAVAKDWRCIYQMRRDEHA